MLLNLISDGLQRFEPDQIVDALDGRPVRLEILIEQILVVDQPVGFDDERDAKDFTVIAFQCSVLVSQLLIGFAV